MSFPPTPSGVPSPTPGKPPAKPPAEPRTAPVTADQAVGISSILGGAAVFPLNADKTPRLPGSWPEYSTFDEAGIRRLWGMAGGSAYVGLDCGKSALVVLDVDDPAGLPSALLDVLSKVDTLILRSLYRGGEHFYFRGVYAGRTIPGGDLKASGGYVLVSADKDMHRAEIAELPDGIVKLFDLRVPGAKRPVAGGSRIGSSLDEVGWEAWLDSHSEWLDSEEQADSFISEVVERMREKVRSGSHHRRMAALDAVWSSALEIAAGFYPGWTAYSAIGAAYREMRDLDPVPGKRWTAQRDDDYKLMWVGAIARIESGSEDGKLEAMRRDKGIDDDPYLVPVPPPLPDGAPYGSGDTAGAATHSDSKTDFESVPGDSTGTAKVTTSSEVSAPEIVTLPPPEPVVDGWVEDGITLPSHLRLYRKGDLHGTVSPLGEGAFHGAIGDLLRLFDGETEAQTESVAAALLPMFGAWLGRDILLKVGIVTHSTNLFVALVGPTGRARKGTAQSVADSVMRLVDMDFLDVGTSGGFGSGQSLVHYLRDPVFDADGILKAGRYDQRLCIRESELARLFATVHAEGSVMSHVLREAYDHSRPLSTTALTTGVGVRSSLHHVSLFGGITPEELLASFGGLSAYNGLGNRFLWAYADKRLDLPGGGAVDPDRLSDICLGIGSRALRGERTLYLEDVVRERWAGGEYGRLKDLGELPDVGGMLARQADLVMRTALIYAALDGSDLVSMAHFDAGLAWEVFSRESMGAVLAGMVGGELSGLILASLRSHPGTAVLKSDLARTLPRWVSAAALDAALSGLERVGLLHRFRGPLLPTGGRPATLLVATITR